MPDTSNRPVQCRQAHHCQTVYRQTEGSLLPVGAGTTPQPLLPGFIILLIKKSSTMKKLFFLAAFYCLHAAADAKPVSGKEPQLAHRTKPSGYDRALHHFSLNYSGTADASWISFTHQGFLCTFHSQGMVNRVHYDKNGNWMYTISGYGPASLSTEVSDQVLFEYPGYKIRFVNEIVSSTDPVYVINIENEINIKVIRVCADQIDVLQDLEKAADPANEKYSGVPDFKIRDTYSIQHLYSSTR
jgi:hypothetical protein